MEIATMLAVANNNVSGSCAAVTKMVIDGKTFVSTATVEQSIGKVYNRRLLLQGAIAAVKACGEPCMMKVFTSDEYLRMVVANYPTWEANGGMTRPVYNDDGEVEVPAHKVYNYDLIKALSHAIHTTGVRLDVHVLDSIAPRVQKIADDLLVAVPAAEEMSKEKALENEYRLVLEAYNSLTDERVDEMARACGIE